MDDENKKKLNIEDIPKPEEELTNEEAKNVQGGFYGTGVYKATDQVRTLAPGNTVGGSLSVDPSNPNKP